MDGFFNSLQFYVPVWDVVLRLGVAALFGGIIGFDREHHDKPAGVRTHMMVCLGAAGFTILALQFALDKDFEQVRIDPSRMLQGIVTGIGFLGAGTIIQNQNRVEGITTASGIWVSGGIGAMAGAGYYGLAAITTLMAIVILTVLGFIKHITFGSTEDNKRKQQQSD